MTIQAQVITEQWAARVDDGLSLDAFCMAWISRQSKAFRARYLSPVLYMLWQSVRAEISAITSTFTMGA